jgi:hypothetical protein
MDTRNFTNPKFHTEMRALFALFAHYFAHYVAIIISRREVVQVQ